jgi:hypothetical protein
MKHHFSRQSSSKQHMKLIDPQQIGGEDINYFKENADLNEREKKWCRCVLHVAAKQSDQCLENVNENAGKLFDGKSCYNFYAVCSSTVGTSSRKCGINYEFRNIPDNELVAYAKIKKIVVPKPYVREQMIQAIFEWKKREK